VIAIIVIIVILVVLGIIFAAMYNSLVTRRNQVDNSWSQIDVQLKRRHDLIPNLVEAVKDYMSYEQETLTNVTQARAAAVAAGAQGPEAQAKAEALVRQARAGADFVKLVKENSGDKTSLAKDGDFPPIRKSDAQVPPEIKNALFAAKPGEVTDPLRQPRGFYVFRIQESGPQPLEEVQKSITDELKSTQLRTWMDELKNSVDVKMEGEAPAPAPAAPAPSGSAAPPQK